MTTTKEKIEGRGKIASMLSKIEKNTRKVATNYGPIEAINKSKRGYIAKFTIQGEDIPEGLEAEYDEEYELKVKVRVCEVGDTYGDANKKPRIELEIQKILDIDEIGDEED